VSGSDPREAPGDWLAPIVAAAGPLGLFTRFDADAVRRAGVAAPAAGPLAGLIVGVKDNIAVAGSACSAGLGARAGAPAATDAGATARLRAAGARLVPGLAMDEGALGATGENPHFGACRNPRYPDRIAGGSSAGPAALVAAGLADAALGTDTLGSVRIPAAYCGLLGLKPTRGAIGRSGVAPLAPSLDTVGILARAPDVLARVFDVLAGPDDDDPESLPCRRGAAMPPRRIGLPDARLSASCAPEVRRALERAGALLAGQAHRMVPVALAGWRPEALRRAAFLLVEAEGAVSFAAELAIPGTLSPGLRRLLEYGRDVPAARLVAALAEMRAAAAALARALARVDALLLPGVAHVAPRRGVPPPPDQADFTALANVAGTPALVLPVAVPGGGPPASVQLVGRHGAERGLIALAGQIAGALAEDPG